MKFTTPLGTNEHVPSKVPVAATALTCFEICNTSNVLSPLRTPRLTFREVNCASRWGRVKSHLREKQLNKRKCHFSIGSEHIHLPLWRSGVKSEGHGCSQSKIAKKQIRWLHPQRPKSPGGYKGGGANDTILGKESPF